MNYNSVVIRLKSLVKSTEKRSFNERMSSRMVMCASVLPEGEYLGWQMIVPTKGTVKMTLFGSKSLDESDLMWIAEKTAKTGKSQNSEANFADLSELFELYLPVAERNFNSTVGFSASPERIDDSLSKWPLSYSDQFEELIDAFRRTGAVYKAVIGAASEKDQERCRKHTLSSFVSGQIEANNYIGRPVLARFLVRLPSFPSIRLKTILTEAVPGTMLRHIGSMGEVAARELWDNPLKDALALPDYASRIMVMEPDLKESIIGIEVCEESLKTIPLSQKLSKSDNAVVIGKATDVMGVKRKVTVRDIDLRRHYQIVGQTGCGKSTLLATVILSAIEQGKGLTFFDPHGTTIDTVLRCVPEKDAHRIRVVRIGDADNPVPLNIWDSDDPIQEERNINDLCELFADIFDPNNQGFVGPRYERWLTTFAKASIAFLGRRASLESIAVISQSKDNMKKVADAIAWKYPDLYAIIKNEYGMDNSNDFNACLSWYLCKFQRICAVEQLRKTLGAGANALDFQRNIDTDTVTLIDLASPTIGTHAARIVGTLTLMKLWNAAITRKEREKTHLIVLDEASLFLTNPLPRILSEGRKFGVACVMCHQHTAQLTHEIREALEANSANFSAFRLSPMDAVNAAVRFEDPDMKASLTRLGAFNAVTTLSVDGVQTAPFTLETIRPKQQKNGEQIATMIEQNSINELVKPFEDYRALLPCEIQKYLNAGKANEASLPKKDSEARKGDKVSDESDFMKKWTEYRNQHLKAV